MPSRSAAAVMMRRLAWCGIMSRRLGRDRQVALEQVAADFVHLADGVLEDLLAVLLDVVHARFCTVSMRGGHAAAAGRHVRGVAAGAVDFVQEVDEAGAVVLRTGSSSMAPAPSPNSTQVLRSV